MLVFYCITTTYEYFPNKFKAIYIHSKFIQAVVLRLKDSIFAVNQLTTKSNRLFRKLNSNY